MMPKFFREWRQRNRDKQLLLRFGREVNKNLEQYYVMFQINRLRFFTMDCWEQVQGRLDLFPDERVRMYAEDITAYHEALREFKKFETWYMEDSSRKTRENGIQLHDKKKTAWQKFSGLEDPIKQARVSLREMT